MQEKARESGLSLDMLALLLQGQLSLVRFVHRPSSIVCRLFFLTMAHRRFSRPREPAHTRTDIYDDQGKDAVRAACDAHIVESRPQGEVLACADGKRAAGIVLVDFLPGHK